MLVSDCVWMIWPDAHAEDAVLGRKPASESWRSHLPLVQSGTPGTAICYGQQQG